MGTSETSVAKEKTQRLLRVALILSVVTAIEFVIAFTVGAGLIKTALFVLLTVVKAFYIVGEFMHLSHERKSLLWSLLFPMVFIFLLIFILIYESGHAIHGYPF